MGSVLCVGMVGNALAVLDQMGAEEMSCGAGIEVVGLYARIVSPRREGMGHPAQVPWGGSSTHLSLRPSRPIRDLRVCGMATSSWP